MMLDVALTNGHIIWNPLRSADGPQYICHQRGILFIGQHIAKKRLQSQEEYCDRCCIRLSCEIKTAEENDENEQSNSRRSRNEAALNKTGLF